MAAHGSKLEAGVPARVRALLRRASRLTPATLRAGVWAHRACRAIERGGGVMARPPLPAVPRVPLGAKSGVHVVLRLRREQCLVRSSVRQAFLAAHGDVRDVVIGTTGVQGFAAHAWLSGEDGTDGRGYEELLRLPAVPLPAGPRAG